MRRDIMKKRILTILLCFVLVIQVVGCGAQTEQGSTNEPASNEPVKLVVWGGVPAESGPQAVVDAWNASHPDIQVEYVRFVNDDTGNTKLDTAIMSGQQIDLFFTYLPELLKKRASGNMIEPLESYGVEEFIKSEITTNLDQVMKIEGQFYSVPTVKEFFGFMINEDIMKAQGVTIPDNWTVDEFVEIAKKLTVEKDGKKTYGVHPYYSGLPLNFGLTILGGDCYYKENGKESNFDAEEFRMISNIQELMEDGYSMPFGDVFSRKLEMYSHSAFLNEEVAMIPFSTWMLRYVKDLEKFPHDFKTTFAHYPTVKKGVPNKYQAYLNNYLSINANSKHKQEAWEFMKYWVAEGSEYMLGGGKIPAWNKSDQQKVIEMVLGDNADKLFNADDYERVVMNSDMEYIVDTITVAYPQIIEIYKEESEKYFIGINDEDTYFKNLKSRADKAISKELSK